MAQWIRGCLLYTSTDKADFEKDIISVKDETDLYSSRIIYNTYLYPNITKIKNYAGISDLLYVGIFACNLAIGCTITDKTDKISYNK